MTSEASVAIQVGTYYKSIVVQGKQIARTLGMPTANIFAPIALNMHTPGVYAGRTVVGECFYESCIFLAADGTLESHCIGHTDLELYGKEIMVTIIAKVRDMLDFSGWTLEQIREQLAKDLEGASALV